MKDKLVKNSLETRTVHAGEPNPRINGAVVMPVFQTAMFLSAGEKNYDEIRYIRLNNTPNHRVLADKLADLENGESAVLTSSGMSAISTTLLTLLSSGDHLLAQDCLYGGTHDFVTKDIGKFGISYDFINGNDPASWASKLKSSTRAIYVETISNPLMGVPDLDAVVKFAKANDLVSVIDNTFASPVNYCPLDSGFDLSLHSATKYLNGHSDIVAGAVIGRDQELVERITHRLNHLGGSLDPHAAFLLQRGMKTLVLRVRQQNATALKIAQHLEKHPSIKTVNYPGLANHPQHSIARTHFSGYGGMMSFELHGGADASETFLRNVKIPLIAPSLGGVESLMTRPAITSHSGMATQDRKKLGITDGLIRFSVGIEGAIDLIADLDQSLDKIRLAAPNVSNT